MAGTTGAHRFRRAAWLALCLAISNLQSPISLAQEIPLTDRPEHHFYGASGVGVKVAWSLDRTAKPGEPIEVREDEELVATLVITNATNPRNITRPDLTKLPEFQDRFVVTDVPGPPPEADAKEVRFKYRLRPRSRQTEKLPVFEFAYFNPTAAVGKKQWPLTTTRLPIPVRVTAAPVTPPPAPVPLSEPEDLFAIATGPALLESRPFDPPSWLWLVVLLAGLVLAIGWYVVWRRVYPDAGRLAKLRRSRAARRAVDAIRRSGRATDPPAAMAAAVFGYLRSRFPLPPGTVTPSEVGAALVEVELPAAESAAVADFLRECDAARFSPSGTVEASLAADAEALISRLEAA